MMTIGSLFSGIGGLELGLEACGLGPVRWQCEIDPFARAVLAKHWPEVPRFEDVRGIDETIEHVDIICGGFPCIDISNAGKQAGIEGKHSSLWFEFARVVRVVRPRFVFVENVAALVTRGLDRVLGDLAELGFDAEWAVFRACDAGAPHRRRRVFILAHSHGRGLEVERSAKPQGKQGTRGNVPNGRGVEREHSFPPGRGESVGRPGTEPAVRRGAHGLSNRVDRLRCLGNAVVPQQAALAWRTLWGRG